MYDSAAGSLHLSCPSLDPDDYSPWRSSTTNMARRLVEEISQRQNITLLEPCSSSRPDCLPAYQPAHTIATSYAGIRHKTLSRRIASESYAAYRSRMAVDLLNAAYQKSHQHPSAFRFRRKLHTINAVRVSDRHSKFGVKTFRTLMMVPLSTRLLSSYVRSRPAV